MFVQLLPAHAAATRAAGPGFGASWQSLTLEGFAAVYARMLGPAAPRKLRGQRVMPANTRRLVELMLRSSRAGLGRVGLAAAVAECYGASANRITVRLGLLRTRSGCARATGRCRWSWARCAAPTRRRRRRPELLAAEKA
jgi:hypothetical protein